MCVLAFDTSSKYDSCCIVDLEGNLLASISSQFPKLQSENILDVIEFALKSAKISKKDISKIGVCKGPGSFTGIRIGISTAMGLAKGLGIKAYGIDKFTLTEYESSKIPLLNKKGIFFDKNSKKVEKSSENVEIGSLTLTNSEIIAKILTRDNSKIDKSLLALY